MARKTRTAEAAISDDEAPDILASLLADDRAEKEKRARVAAEQRYKEACARLAEYEAQDQILEELDRRKIRGIARNKTSFKTGDSTAIICACDWHAEENVDPRTVNNLNKFNLDICADRVARLWQKSVELIDSFRSFTNVSDIVLWLGGDLINGFIHEELVESNFLGPAEAVDFVEGQVCDGIATLRKQIKLPMVVLGSNGNHGRTSLKTKHSTGWRSSWEYLMHRHLARVHATTPGVDVFANRGYHWIWDVQKHRVRLHHGDAVRFLGGVGGISIPLNKSISQWNKSTRVDFDIIGHWHSRMEAWNFVSCGCLVGYGAFALSIKADYQPPTQELVLVSKSHGKCLSIPIFVDKSK